MRVRIDVANRHEGDAVARALGDPVIKASTVMAGILLDLESPEDRRRVLSFLRETLDRMPVVPVPSTLGNLGRLHAADNGE